MIEINLLPKELRKQKRKQKAAPAESASPVITASLPGLNIPIIPICAGVLGLFVLAHTGMALVANRNVDIASRLQVEWKGLEPQKRILDRIRGETGELRRRLALIRKVSNPDIEWTKLLSGLNQSVIADIWLKDFKPVMLPIGTGGAAGSNIPISLKLEGYALGKSEVATSTVARFINSLKANRDFSEYFDEIELQDIRSARVSNAAAMEFRLICGFKKKAPEAVKKKR